MILKRIKDAWYNLFSGGEELEQGHVIQDSKTGEYRVMVRRDNEVELYHFSSRGKKQPKEIQGKILK